MRAIAWLDKIKTHYTDKLLTIGSFANNCPPPQTAAFLVALCLCALQVSDEDNIKQDISIDVYGRKEKEDSEVRHAVKGAGQRVIGGWVGWSGCWLGLRGKEEWKASVQPE